jgi:hypothetical protein
MSFNHFIIEILQVSNCKIKEYKILFMYDNEKEAIDNYNKLNNTIINKILLVNVFETNIEDIYIE